MEDNIMKKIQVGKYFSISNNDKLCLIAGPCQLENLDHSLFMAESLKKICHKLNMNFVFKASFDKANRSSISGKRGVGLKEGMKIFSKIKEEFDLPCLTDVHEASQCQEVAEAIDIIQIPALLSRQTDLILAAAETGKVVNVKKGQFMAPWDVKNIIGKMESTNNHNLLITDRGTSFGYNTLITDIRGLSIIKEYGYPVIFDATHSVQQPSFLGGSSGGQREFVPVLAKAACTVGLGAIFLETHQEPDSAPSDGPCMWKLHEMESLLKTLLKIDDIVKNPV